MSRRPKEYRKRQIVDPRHGSLRISKFINKVMIGGKKSTAEGIVYDALDRLSKKSEMPVTEAFDKVLKN